MVTNNSLYYGKTAFGPNFVPPIVLHRDPEKDLLSGTIYDAFQDNTATKIIYQGPSGEGKRVLVENVITNFRSQGFYAEEIIFPSVNCRSNPFQKLYNFLLSYLNFKNPIQNINLKKNNETELWSLIKKVSIKLNRYIVLVLYNIHFAPNLLRKLINLEKGNFKTIILTFDNFSRVSLQNNDFNMNIRLDRFTYQQLIDIIKQRCAFCFRHEIDNDLIDFIGTLVYESSLRIPIKAINILKEIYDFLEKSSTINHEKMFKICPQYFESFSLCEEEIFLYLNDFFTDILMYFIANICEIFKTNYSINSRMLIELYKVACESAEVKFDISSLNQDINNLVTLKIIMNERRLCNMENRENPNYNLFEDNFFITCNPEKLRLFVIEYERTRDHLRRGLP